MTDTSPLEPLDSGAFFRIGCAVEFGLVGVAALIEWVRLEVPFPYLPLQTDLESVKICALALIPLLVWVVFATSDLALRIPALRGIYDRLLDIAGPSLSGIAVWQCAILSIGAGVGEEFLFRGVLQEWWGFGWTCLFFGALHAVTWAYFFFAFGMSAYLGWLYFETDDIAVPVTLHAVYDFVALLLIRKRLRADAVTPRETDGERED